MKWFKSSRLALVALGALALIASCGGRSATTGTDSNTHWLKECDGDDDCGRLSCICGVCSKRCGDAVGCEAFGPGAACEVPRSCEGSAAEPACVPTGAGGVGAGGSSAGGAGASAGSSAAGASSGSAGTGSVPDPACSPMDARTGASNCATIAGYVFDGAICAPVFCACEGSDCGDMFESMAACDRAYAACYERRGVSRACTTHADCTLVPRRCCAPCGIAGADDMLGVRDGTPVSALRDGGICSADPDNCPECVANDSPAVYPACVDGQCQAFDVAEAAACDSDDDCSARLKDCCGCREATGPDLVAANQTFFRPDYCPLAMSCVACNPPVIVADNVRVRCAEGTCALDLLPR